MRKAIWGQDRLLAAQDRHLQGRTLIRMGETIGYLNPDKGLAHIEHGLQLINPVREPRLELEAQHSLALFLCEAGRAPEAFAIIYRVRPLFREFPDDSTQLRFHWLQGRVAYGLRLLAEAVDIFRQVAEEFRARDRRLDFLLVMIDLAEGLVALREWATAGRALADATPLLASWNPHRNALAAWLLFQKELDERRAAGATAADALFSQIRLYPRRYWHVPSAEFSVR